MARRDRSPPENAVIFHHPDVVETDREMLMGRHAAGEGFLKGFVENSGVDKFFCQSLEDDHAKDFARRVTAFDDDNRECVAVSLGAMGSLEEVPDTLWIPGPSLGIYAWRRRLSGPARNYSICGLNHTIASDTVMDGLGELLTAPVQPWDAVICTSQAVKTAIKRLLDNWGDYLGRKAGGRLKAEFQLPVIPLGVDCRRFDLTEATQGSRFTIRRGLGIEDDDVAVLFFGRLSFHAKAHPLPMYQALETAAQRTGKRIHLLQTGWFANEGIEREFRAGLHQFAPSINGIFLDSRDPSVRSNVWFAADIFTSLSDNIQESFGLTPIEAMAAGLPSVVSDWNGYKDTVRHGEDGFRVPTWMPLAESGADLSLSLESSMDPSTKDRAYNHYCGIISQSTAVDVGVAADAFSALVSDPGLRGKMGEAAKRRAEDHFDWRVVVNAYQDLWRELANVRLRSLETGQPVSGRPAHPLRDDPFSLFAGYPSHAVDGDTVVQVQDAAEGGGNQSLSRRLEQIRAASMNTFSAHALLDDDNIGRILNALETRGACTVLSLAETLEEGLRFRLPRTLAWLAKMGLVKLVPGAEASGTVSVAGPGPGTGPNQTEAGRLVSLGVAARSRGAMEAAAEYFIKALKEDPADAEANFHFGELNALAGKFDHAAVCLGRSVDKAPGYVAARRSLGKVLFLKGQETEGIRVLEETLDIAPDDGETHYLLGASYRRTGSANQAIAHLEKAIDANPTRADALAHLALAQKSLSRRDEAMDTLVRALNVDPANLFAQASMMSLKAETAGRGTVAGLDGAKRVGLHMNWTHQFSLLAPLFKALMAGHWPLITGDGRELEEFDPDVVITCEDECSALKKLLPETRFVSCRSSLATKRFFKRVRTPADFICVTSEWAAQNLLERGGYREERLWVTGHPACDGLFRQDLSGMNLDIPVDENAVLYSPTFSPHMSSAAMLGDKIVERIRGELRDLHVIIKPHPHFLETGSDIVAQWQAAADGDKRVHFIGGPEVDVAPYLLASDLLVSDASGVALQYLALDKPIVLVTNTKRAQDEHFYDSGGPEWEWRDMADEVEDVDKLAAAVGRGLDDSDRRRERRQEYRQRLFGELRGRCGGADCGPDQRLGG